jgi:hypothetical protein
VWGRRGDDACVGFYLVLFVAFVRDGDAVVGWASRGRCPHRGAALDGNENFTGTAQNGAYVPRKGSEGCETAAAREQPRRNAGSRASEAVYIWSVRHERRGRSECGAPESPVGRSPMRPETFVKLDCFATLAIEL